MGMLPSVLSSTALVLGSMAATGTTLAAGGTATLDTGAPRALEANAKNCLLTHPAQGNPASYQLLLGPRSGKPWSLTTNFYDDEDPGNDSFRYSQADEHWVLVSERARARYDRCRRTLGGLRGCAPRVRAISCPEDSQSLCSLCAGYRDDRRCARDQNAVGRIRRSLQDRVGL